MMASFFIWLVILALLNFVISSAWSLLLPNPYLAQIRCSLTIALIYSIIKYFPEGKARFKDKNFYASFRTMGIIFLIRDLLVFVL